MESQKKMMVVFGLVAAVFLQCAAAQITHLVGDILGKVPGFGWASPLKPEYYSTWASGRKFVVGDTLTFKFMTKVYDVAEVSEQVYDTCNNILQIVDSIKTGPANLTLNSAGPHYYICTFGHHCQSGQKLAINVSAFLTSPDSSPSEPSTSTTTITTPGVTAVPSSSSSPAVGAGFVLCSLSLIVGLFV